MTQTTNGNSARVLISADHDGCTLSPLTSRLVSAARGFALPVDLLIAGEDCSKMAAQAARLDGISQVLLADQPGLSPRKPEHMAACLSPLLMTSHDVLLTASNSTGRELVPRLAAQLDVSPLSDVIDVLDSERFVRPVHAGVALMEVRMLDAKKLMTVRPAGFEPAGLRADRDDPAELVICAPVKLVDLTELMGNASSSDQSSFENARIIIGLGRGAKGNRELIEQLARRLGAVVGGSRVAVELGMVPNNAQIGQTGVKVAPDLYIALGISGAVQHIAGMRDAKTVIAVNKDPEAPIFRHADYGLVADLNDILPELETLLAQSADL